MDQKLKLPNPSSQLHGGAYDPQTGRLTVVLNGGTYAHHNVDPEDVENLEAAPSHGVFYHQVIQKKYPKPSRIR